MNRKPELIVAVVLFALLVLPSIASAADAISTHAVGDYLTGEALYLFQLAMILVFFVGLAMIGIGSLSKNPGTKAVGYGAVAAVVGVALLYYVVPGILSELGSKSTSTAVFSFGGNNSTNGEW